MKKQTFDAFFKLLASRWKWGDGEEEAADFYYDRLWAKVESWRGEWAKAFKVAVEEIVGSDRYGRPSVDQIVGKAASLIPKRTEERSHIDRAHLIASRFRGYYEQGWYTFRSSSAYICRWVGCHRGELDTLWAANFLRKQCGGCLFGTSYALRRFVDVEETTEGTRQVPTDRYQLQCCECGHEWSETITDLSAVGAKYEEPSVPDDPEVPDGKPWERAEDGIGLTPEQRRERIVSAAGDYTARRRGR